MTIKKISESELEETTKTKILRVNLEEEKRELVDEIKAIDDKLALFQSSHIHLKG